MTTQTKMTPEELRQFTANQPDEVTGTLWSTYLDRHEDAGYCSFVTITEEDLLNCHWEDIENSWSVDLTAPEELAGLEAEDCSPLLLEEEVKYLTEMFEEDDLSYVVALVCQGVVVTSISG